MSQTTPTHANMVDYVEHCIKHLVDAESKTHFDKIFHKFIDPNALITINGKNMDRSTFDPVIFGWMEDRRKASVTFTEAIQAQKSAVPNFQIRIQEKELVDNHPVTWEIRCTFNAAVNQAGGLPGEFIPMGVVIVNLVYNKTRLHPQQN